VTEQNFEQMRRAMVVSQLRTTGVSDARVVSAMGSVPRERFVGPDRAALAYLDTPVPLGGGRALNPPMVTGRLLTEAQIVAGEKVLLIGAATGYAAAVLAALGAEVTAVEEDAALVAMGKAAGGLVAWIEAPLSAGYAAGAPYSLIVIDGAVEEIPAAIVDQLADGGRIAAGLVENGVTRLAIGRRAGGSFGMTTFVEAAVPILPGFASPEGFRF
jgi:protein-L-isoaspartate(D-aspartate) O-methyltransferase